MQSATRTLLDPFEVAGVPRPTLPSLSSLEQVTEWFERCPDAMPLSLSISDAAQVEEYREPPPWTPEPIDRRWRARCWTHDA